MNVHVSFQLAGNLAPGWPWMNMDGLLAHLEFRKKLGDEYRLLPTKTVSDQVPKLPIKETNGIYHCSVSILPNKTIGNVTTFYKRFASNMAYGAKGRIDRSRGFFKDYVLRTPYFSTDRLDFYANIQTERSWLEDLFDGLVGLGKEINIGFGWIKSYTIEEIKQDMGLIDPERNIAMRPIPIEMLSEYSEVEGLAYHAPYWDRSHTSLCAVPFTKVKIKDIYMEQA
jgi:hypothetical protein